MNSPNGSYPDLSDVDAPQKATDGELKYDTVDIIKQVKDESRRARMPRELEWNRSWNLYNNAYDFSRKAKWQSKNWIPRVNTSVRAAAQLLKKGLVGAKEYHDTKGYGEVGRTIAPYVHSLTKFHMKSGDFPTNYARAALAGMLNSLVCLKVYPKVVEGVDYTMSWNRAGPTPFDEPVKAHMVGDILAANQKFSKKRKRLTVRYDPISAYDLFPDPWGDGMYVVHEIDMDAHNFRAMAYAHRDIFDMDAVHCVIEEWASWDKQVQEANRKGEEVPSKPPFRKRIRVDEFWGDILGYDGELMFRNAYAMTVNEKYLVVPPCPNKLPTGKHPFIMHPIIEKPFSTWHQSFVESVAGIQVMLTELSNMMLDSNLFNSIKAFEVDIDQVYDPNELVNGIYPGKTYKKRANGVNNSPMIRDVSAGTINPQGMELYLALDREYQNGTGLNEYILPQARVRSGRVTATETTEKGQQSSEFFGEIARSQEDGVVVPALEMTYAYILEYQRDFTDPLLVELMGEEHVAKAQVFLTNSSLRDFLKSAPVKFECFGMSKLMQRMKDFEKILTFLQLVGNVSKVMPQVLQMIDVKELLEMAVDAMLWDSDKVLTPAGRKGPGGQPIQPVMSPNQPGGGLPPVGSPRADVNGNGLAGMRGNMRVPNVA